ncbi:unnamed protein product [Rotaria sp. Silwood2]|nr:unnamed protein product [Rotaria sp. Silwood2]CAF4186820.1 unnamed protein product [Rotaria sp. Silwood2]
MKQIFDPQIDEKDQKTDLDVIQGKLNEIASILVEQQTEQLRHYEWIEQNISQRFKSFKIHLQQNIDRIHDPVKAQDFVKEEQAFLHIPYHDLIQGTLIGQGGFGDVYRGRWLSRDHEVVIKKVRIQYLHDNHRKDLVNEISMMYQIRYDHILNIFGGCMEPENYALIVEYMSLGSLYDVLKEQTLQLSWTDRWSIAYQMTKGINYLHKLQKAIIHRDIKSLNILLKENGKDFLTKIADFGLAEIRHETMRQSSYNPFVGTLQWKAPELLEMGRHTEASDVYALGVVLWELGTGCEAYKGADAQTIDTFVRRGDRLKIPINIPKSFSDIISRAWAQEPLQRPTCQQLLNLMKDVSSEVAIKEKLKTAAASTDRRIVEEATTGSLSPQQHSTRYILVFSADGDLTFVYLF